MGILRKARYLSSNSGATWVTVPLAAKQLVHRLDKKEPFDFDYYLGTYVEPEHIQGDYEKELGKIGVILGKADIIKYGEDNSPQKEATQPESNTALYYTAPSGVGESGGEVSAENNILEQLTEFFTGTEDSNTTLLERVQEVADNNVVQPLANLKDNIIAPKSNFTAWVQAIDCNFVKEMGVDSSSRDFYDKIRRAYVSKANTNLYQTSAFPFPIYVATAYPEGDKPGIAAPFEFTPFYAGIPMNPHIFGNKNFDTGGGHAEYRVFNSSVKDPYIPPPLPPATSQDPPNYHYQVKLPDPGNVLNIAEVTGISSSFFGAAVVNLGWRQNLVDQIIGRLPGVPLHVKRFTNPTTYQYWSPVSGGPSRGLAFVDGGLFDNTGVLALLRRNCSCIIACVASDAAINDEDPETNRNRFGDLAALFGQYQQPLIDRVLMSMASLFFGVPFNFFLTTIGLKPNTVPIQSPNDFKVFDAADWKPLVRELNEKWQKGVPQVVRMNLTVHENLNASIYGNRTVDFIVCLNGRVKETWYNKLGNEGLKKQITPEKTGEPYGPEVVRWVWNLKKPTKLSNYFPYFSTFRVIYDNSTVNMMAHLSSFALKTGLEDVKFDVSHYERSN
jgi:hypothetical protein